MSNVLDRSTAQSLISSHLSSGTQRVAVRDSETLRWAAGRQTPGVTIADLEKHTQRRVAELMRLPNGWDHRSAKSVSSDVAQLTQMTVRMLLSKDDLATPQFSPTPTGGVVVVWLVADWELGVQVDIEGLEFWALNPDGDDALQPTSFNFREPNFVDNVLAAVLRYREFLEEISLKVSRRLPLS